MILHSCDDYKVSLITKKQTKYTRKYVKSLQHDLRKKNKSILILKGKIKIVSKRDAVFEKLFKVLYPKSFKCEIEEKLNFE